MLLIIIVLFLLFWWMILIWEWEGIFCFFICIRFFRWFNDIIDVVCFWEILIWIMLYGVFIFLMSVLLGFFFFLGLSGGYVDFRDCINDFLFVGVGFGIIFFVIFYDFVFFFINFDFVCDIICFFGVFVLWFIFIFVGILLWCICDLFLVIKIWDFELKWWDILCWDFVCFLLIEIVVFDWIGFM